MKAPKKHILELATQAYSENRRLAAPLMGFPGRTLTGFSIKVAQQNHGAHFACINALGLPVRFPINESSTVEKHPIDCLDMLDDYRNTAGRL